MSLPRTSLFLLLVSVLLSLSPVAFGLTTFIKANAEACFMEEVERGDRLLSTFAVQSGGFMDVDVKIYGPDLKIVFKEDRVSEGDVQFVATISGLHKLCFGNYMSTVTGKVVMFHMYVGNMLHEHDAAAAHHLDPLEKAISEMSTGLYSLKDHQNYMRDRDKRQGMTHESTNSRIFWFHLLETAALVGVGTFQLMWLTSSLDKRRKGSMSSSSSMSSFGQRSNSMSSSSMPSSFGQRKQSYD